MLGGNQLTGMIPDELGNLKNLRVLVITANEIDGAIPEWLGDLSDLESLWLNGNQLSGPIPDRSWVTSSTCGR